ncbi:uncharacterized protein L969DRAFT_47020 [Mixia osmundae IAM 14324]|uniref:NAD-dependent epimerase/dehydratase domain-containing protein n=1 Tax=Mixia osmundae (strain CBS 9802 / IAM 14324 / JCM 22182 / KY 12970) TaxID=764103 RepID=G7E625_MIXOS|nr:uncharacterized protein L969DRAFT_47020 [Mixia osmundae IAM 14324]KEI40565.1 hypothetical protein L969DRAFT_47020 [Mixia osmundae IAM 14324]GAA98285.1 hypothetical protein E5Q_04968 [Mixia osmundae IAM 14324]
MGDLILITGVTGFLATHVVGAALEAGYKVRGTVRDLSKGDSLSELYPSRKDQLELVEVKDLIHSDLTEAFKDVKAIIHTASPYVIQGIEDPEKQLLSPAIEGTLNVMRAARAASVQRVVITSSFAAVTLFDKGGPWRDYTYTEDDWNPATFEQANDASKPGAWIYSASKALAEKAAWNFAKENDIELVTMCPPMIYSKTIQKVTSKAKLNTSSATIYNLISKPAEMPDNRLPLFCDARDVAKAHVQALKTDGAVGHRVLLCGGSYTWQSATKLLLEQRPELKDRLPSLDNVEDETRTIARLDTTIAQRDLGIQFISFEQCLLDSVDQLLAMEKQW